MVQVGSRYTDTGIQGYKAIGSGSHGCRRQDAGRKIQEEIFGIAGGIVFI